MTTIAYRDGVIAYDSRCTAGSTITTDDYDKRQVVDGVSFICCGPRCDYEPLIRCYFGEPCTKPDADSAALVANKGRVEKIGIDNGAFWRQPANTIEALGSGSDHALTAMDMGADAKTAVKMAMKRDTCTGGRIRTYKLK